ncbi:MAG: hypothetical protein KGZ89_00065 [Actinobacteria bacterium]|nr:hypothetical protein [Actinomycetota bacterium]
MGKKFRIVSLFLTGVLCLTIIGGILWHQNRVVGEAVPNDGHEAYLKVISTGGRGLLENVPEYIEHVASGERIPLRQHAKDLLDGTRGEAVDMLGFYLMEPRTGQSIASPVRVKLWHATNHYGGGILRITDTNGNTLARLQLPEISHYNLTQHAYETEITFEQPATTGGFIVGHLWSAKDEYPDDYKKAAVSIPIVFR